MRDRRHRGGGAEGGGGGVTAYTVIAEVPAKRGPRRMARKLGVPSLASRLAALRLRHERYTSNGSFSPSGSGISNAFSVTETRL